MQKFPLNSEEFLALMVLSFSRAELMRKSGKTLSEVNEEDLSGIMQETLTNFYDVVVKKPEHLDKKTMKVVKQILGRTKSLVKFGE